VTASRRYWHEDIIEPEVTVSAQGTFGANRAGYWLCARMDRIDKFTVRKERLPESVYVETSRGGSQSRDNGCFDRTGRGGVAVNFIAAKIGYATFLRSPWLRFA